MEQSVGMLLGQFGGKRLTACFELLQLIHEQARVDALQDRGLDGADGALGLGELYLRSGRAIAVVASRRRISASYSSRKAARTSFLQHLGGQPSENTRVEFVLTNGEAVAAVGRPFLG
jgi:hypothetical protein